MVRPDEINDIVQQLLDSRHDMPTKKIADIDMVKPPVDDLYKQAALYFLIPYLNFSSVNVTQETDDYEFGSGSLWPVTNPALMAYRNSIAKIVRNHQANISLYSFAKLQEYELILAILNTFTRANPCTKARIEHDLFDSLRLYFDAHEQYPGQTPDGRVHFLEIIFQLARRGYLDLVEFLDELLKSDTIAGDVIIEIQQEIALVYPNKVEVPDRFNL